MDEKYEVQAVDGNQDALASRLVKAGHTAHVAVDVVLVSLQAPFDYYPEWLGMFERHFKCVFTAGKTYNDFST